MKYKNRVQEIALGVGLYISSARHTAQRGFVSAGLLKLGFFLSQCGQEAYTLGKRHCISAAHRYSTEIRS